MKKFCCLNCSGTLSATPPKWVDQSGSNFQGVISAYGECLPTYIRFVKKPKYRKLLLVELLWSPANLANAALARSPCRVGLPDL